MPSQDHHPWNPQRSKEPGAMRLGGPGACPARWTLLGWKQLVKFEFDFEHFSFYFCSFLPLGLWSENSTVGFWGHSMCQDPEQPQRRHCCWPQASSSPVYPPWSSKGILWLRTSLSPYPLQAWFRVLVSEEGKEFWHIHVVWKFQKGRHTSLQQVTFEIIVGD